MKDYEYVQLIVVAPNGQSFDLTMYPQDEVATRASGRKLLQAIAQSRGLEANDFELYVKVPPDKALNALGFGEIKSLALLPISSDLGEIYKPGS